MTPLSSVPVATQDKLPQVLAHLESLSNGTLKEWGVSHTTLEEVFLRVTKMGHFGYEDPEPEPEPQHHEIYFDEELPLQQRSEHELLSLHDEVQFPLGISDPHEPTHLSLSPNRSTPLTLSVHSFERTLSSRSAKRLPIFAK